MTLDHIIFMNGDSLIASVVREQTGVKVGEIRE